jgi:2-phosphoglycerate kinase
MPLAEADDVVTALTVLSTPEQQPMLHRWNTDPGVHAWTPARIADHTIEVAEELRRGFEAVIADHIEFAAPLVMEGDYLLPDFGVRFGGAVRTVVIAEPDEDLIVANFRAREPHGGEQRRRAQVSALFNTRLTARAGAAGVPVVRSRPFDDAVDRVDAALRGIRVTN